MAVSIKYKVPDIKELNAFYSQNRDKSIRCILSQYTALSLSDAEDIFQDACIALFENVSSGKLNELTSSLFSYFMAICGNLANKKLRHIYDNVALEENINYSPNTNMFDDEPLVNDDKMDELSSFLDEIDSNSAERYKEIDAMEEKIRDAVQKMKEPCNHVLWSLYWDNLSHETIAELYGYSSANVSKVTASRCKDKFSKFLESNNIHL